MSDVIATLVSPELQENQRAVTLAQKTELIGQIAQAIAHQFNNVMMAVTSYAELELKKAAPPQKRSLEQVLANAARATSLIQKLLAFSSKHSPAPQTLALSSAMAEINGLLQQLVGESIEVVLNLDPRLPAIHADILELQQIILSLCLHARNSMASGGRLKIVAESVELDSASIGPNEGVTPGRYVLISIGNAATVAGNERKADQNLRDHLALAAVQGMVKDSKGMIRVFSSPKEGSNFKVYFPAVSVQASFAPTNDAAVGKTSLSRTILVVEDDDAVRVPAAEFLMMEGYKVLQAKTGPEALQIVERNKLPLDLLITDMRMPEMGGREVADKLLGKYPDLKILYMSGDSDKITGPSSAKGGHHAVLQKPFRLNILNDKIHDLLTK